MSWRSRRGVVSLSVALVFLASSCTGSSEGSETPGTGAASGCDDATPIVDSEVVGVATDATIHGLAFPTGPLPIRTGDELKIVWRMTGQGELSVTYESPDGAPAVLTFGPVAHTGSSYDRPGDEWGTGFKFDEPGCWHIHLERTEGMGDVWIEVVDR